MFFIDSRKRLDLHIITWRKMEMTNRAYEKNNPTDFQYPKRKY